MLAARTLSFFDKFDLQRRQPKPLSWWQPHPEQRPSWFPHRLEYLVPLSRLERSNRYSRRLLRGFDRKNGSCRRRIHNLTMSERGIGTNSLVDFHRDRKKAAGPQLYKSGKEEQERDHGLNSQRFPYQSRSKLDFCWLKHKKEHVSMFHL